MTHDSPDPHGDGTMGSTPSQANFLGGLALGLLAFMALFTLTIFISAAAHGFQ
jgi:hypothetical protein